MVKHLRRLQNATNGVQFVAQLHEREAVELLVEFMHDPLLPVTLRRQCAIDVTQLARGAVRPWVHTGETINPEAEGTAGLGATVRQEIEAAQNTATLHHQLNMLTAANVHPRDWPADVRAVAADMVAYYAADDAS